MKRARGTFKASLPEIAMIAEIFVDIGKKIPRKFLKFSSSSAVYNRSWSRETTDRIRLCTFFSSRIRDTNCTFCSMFVLAKSDLEKFNSACKMEKNKKNWCCDFCDLGCLVVGCFCDFGVQSVVGVYNFYNRGAFCTNHCCGADNFFVTHFTSIDEKQRY
jgi:hypothetical protein